MKKVRFLLLSLLTMVLFTFTVGCEVAGNSCEEDSDCEGTESCYAGYCGENEPVGGFYLKFNLLEKGGVVGSAGMTCNDANIDDVHVTITTHDFEVLKTTVSCDLINVNDIENAAKNGHLINKLWSNENYDVKVEFIVGGADNITKSFTVRPSLSFVNQPSEIDDQNVLVEKISMAIFTAKWDIEESDGTQHTDSTSCTDLGVTNFKVALDALEPCDENGECDFSEYVSIPCTNAWSTGITVREAVGTSISIYAVSIDTNNGGLTIPFALKSKAVTITQEQLDSGAFERTFHLDDLRGNKK